MSKRIGHAIKVYKKWKGMVEEYIDKEGEIPEETAKNMIQQACLLVADQEGIGVSTVLSQLTRELDQSVEELRVLMMDHLVAENKRNSKFVHQLCKHACKDDRLDEIRDQLEAL